VLAAAAGASAATAPLVVSRTAVAARPSLCTQTTGPLTYHYPLKPFTRQHPIRGFFGDPRTVTSLTFGEDAPGSIGSFTFHNGVDISARTGAPVYPVVSGVVKIASGDRVVIITGDFRTFQYFHVAPTVRTGQRVSAYRDVLGTVRPEWHHVHLTEIDGFRVHNPLDPGHLEPYSDRTIPSVEAVVFKDEHGNLLAPNSLHGRIQIAADAHDLPPIPVPGIWFGLPVTPAVVAWHMASRRITVIPKTIVADFRLTEPPNRDFWHVYAAGTYQNFPVFDHLYFHRPGEYLFNLTPTGLDTTLLPNGTYRITVHVADVCGNRGSLSLRATILNIRP
jgi:hypothetical protein